jgi:hypothetical protein
MARLQIGTSCIVLSLCVMSAVAADESEGLRLFREHVRADLIHHCLECHGGKSVKADFDLSTRERLLDSGFIADTAADSHLMAVILHQAEPEMPFRKPRLPQNITDRIAQWIDHGAPYDKPLTEASPAADREMSVTEADRTFWSFQPLTKPPVPEPADDAWCRTEIDRFILASLESHGLSANAAAEPRILKRRAAFDLLGLPPEFESGETASAGPLTDDAWRSEIDALLASPHYGERWARHWMDVARFAESHGYEQDYDRPHAYHYRDFLIRAFNTDMPYDQFVRWQLAGDELAPDEPLAMMATGFMGAGVFPTQLTESEFESARYDELDDMTATTGVAFLGLSIGCARCHDHKFDPIPSRDYYRVAATFTRTIRTVLEIDADPAGNARRRAEYERRESVLQRQLQTIERDQLAVEFQQWLESNPEPSDISPWRILILRDITARGRFELQPDASARATDEQPETDVITVSARPGQAPVRALRLEALSDPSFPRRGPGLAGNGNFALGDIRVSLDGTPVPIVSAAATHQQNETSLSVAASFDDDPISGWAVDHGGIGSSQAAVFYFAEPIRPAAGSELTVRMTFQHPNQRHTIGRFRFSVAQMASPPVAVGAEAARLQALHAFRTDPSDQDARQHLFQWFCAQSDDWNRVSGELEAHRRAGPQLELTPVQVNSENVPKPDHHANGRGYPHFYEQTWFLNRGDVSQKQDAVEPGILQVLTPASRTIQDWSVERPDSATTGFDRASFAAWLTDAEHPAGHLLARVIVNRVWQHHFGRGIVATPNDFGFQGERPSHPELLEWLAADLIEHGWRLKRLHRQIMTSSVYRQSSEFRPAAAAVDPDNVGLWRFPPRRLEAEAIRDALLSVSGRLDRTMYGPGSLDESMRRRSIYFQIKRSKLIPMMMLFDWPEHLVSIGQRSVTTTAPQALLFMNSAQGRDFAAAFAARLDRKVPVADAYRIAFGRKPDRHEQIAADDFLRHQQMLYEKTKTARAGT